MGNGIIPTFFAERELPLARIQERRVIDDAYYVVQVKNKVSWFLHMCAHSWLFLICFFLKLLNPKTEWWWTYDWYHVRP